MGILSYCCGAVGDGRGRGRVCVDGVGNAGGIDDGVGAGACGGGCGGVSGGFGPLKVGGGPLLWGLLVGTEDEDVGHGTFVGGDLVCVFKDGGWGFGVQATDVVLIELVLVIFGYAWDGACCRGLYGLLSGCCPLLLNECCL